MGNRSTILPGYEFIMVDIPRQGYARNKRIKITVFSILIIILLAAASWYVSRLEPALPTVDRASIWLGTVEEGSMIIEVRGPGKLIPEVETWIAAATEGLIERGLISDIPSTRLKAYSILYKVPLEEIISRLVEEKYGVTRTEKIELSVSEIPDIGPLHEREAYELLRQLLDTRDTQDILTCLRMISGGPEGNPTRKSITPEEGRGSKGAA